MWRRIAIEDEKPHRLWQVHVVENRYVVRTVEGLSQSVTIDNMPAATRDSAALCNPPHVPSAGPFQKPPANRATISTGSPSVFIDNKAVARAGDTAITCNDSADAPQGVVVSSGTVFVG